MAFLISISRVLSVTETSIIFIIPIPPASKEIAAMLLMTIIRVAAEPGQGLLRRLSCKMITEGNSPNVCMEIESAGMNYVL